MTESVITNTEESTNGMQADAAKKRKRVKRLKTIIVLTVIFLLLLPTILCIILGIQLTKLKDQVDYLFSTYLSSTDDYNYAYASIDDLADEILNGFNEQQTDESDMDSDDYADGNVEDKVNDGIIKKNDMDNNTDNVNGINNDMEDDISAVNPYAVDFADVDDDIIEDTDTDEGLDAPDTSGLDEDGQITEDNTSQEIYRDPNGIYYGKKVYLTFDDGPSNITDSILDILAEYGVKATFFVVGYEDEVSKERYRRIVNDGHVLAMHAYKHQYKKIYKSLEDFDKDFTKLWNLLYDTTGYIPTIYRFPGGSLMKKNSIDKYNEYLVEKGVTYYDWNVVNGDAEGIDYTEEQMINNVLNGIKYRKTSIVLMHDGYGKIKTANTLPKILDALISGGAELLPIDENTPLIRQAKAKSVK